MAEACKEDLVVVDARTASRLGSLPRLLLVRSVNAVVRLVDPQTGRIAELHTEGYFKAPPSVRFGVLCSSRRRLAGLAVGPSPPARRRGATTLHPYAIAATQSTNPRERKSRDAQNDTVHTQVALSASQLEPFVVLDVERVETPKVVQPPEKKAASKKRRRQEAPTGPRVMKGFLADVTLARERDLGVNDDQITCRTHLGALLRCGDRVLGYDVRAANLASSVDGLGGNEPDVVLVRKCRKQDPDGPTPKRHWKLDTMEADEVHDEADHTDDREIFLSQLETDREMRSRVNLYKDGDHVDDEDEEGVRLEELLDEMKVEDEVEEAAEDSVLEGVVVRGSGKS